MFHFRFEKSYKELKPFFSHIGILPRIFLGLLTRDQFKEFLVTKDLADDPAMSMELVIAYAVFHVKNIRPDELKETLISHDESQVMKGYAHYPIKLFIVAFCIPSKHYSTRSYGLTHFSTLFKAPYDIGYSESF